MFCDIVFFKRTLINSRWPICGNVLPLLRFCVSTQRALDSRSTQSSSSCVELLFKSFSFAQLLEDVFGNPIALQGGWLRFEQ